MTHILNDFIVALNTNKVSARELVENCLAAIDNPEGEGQRAFIGTYHDRAQQQADMVDQARKRAGGAKIRRHTPVHQRLV